MITYRIAVLLLLLPFPLFSISLEHYLILKGAKPEYVRRLKSLRFNEIVAKLNLFQNEFKGKYDFAYRKENIKKMLLFSRRYRESLIKAEKIFGVSWSVIVAILFLESRLDPNFSKKYHVVTVFYTLSLLDQRGYLQKLRKNLNNELVKRATKRSRWAKKELAVLLSGKIPDPWELYGSWAGAIGLCQFIPSSYVKYGVDGDGDGVVDLYNPGDAIMSVANYLSKNGWGKLRPIKVILKYNRSMPYAETVIGVSRILEGSIEAGL